MSLSTQIVHFASIGFHDHLPYVLIFNSQTPYTLVSFTLEIDSFQSPEDTANFILYQNGVRFGCWGLAVFALSCSLYSMIIEWSMNLFGFVRDVFFEH